MAVKYGGEELDFESSSKMHGMGVWKAIKVGWDSFMICQISCWGC